jgi:Fe(II)/alpha-ketoglutarate-dependent arginine beta-hydroxylase
MCDQDYPCHIAALASTLRKTLGGCAVERLVLSAEEFRAELELVESLTGRYDSIEAETFLMEACVRAHELPERVRYELCRFRMDEWGAFVIGGHAIDDAEIGPTPRHWRDRTHPSTALRYEILIVLYTSLLGDLFGWATQQDGHLMHEVFPIESHELEQLGTGSRTLLTWHTEDAFHPFRGDYLVLACLRNPDRVATMLGRVDDLELDQHDVELLFEEQFCIRPDESHKAKNNSDGTTASFNAIEQMAAAPVKIPVLSGDPGRPYIRADPYFMEMPERPAAAQALRRLIAEMDRQIQPVVLEPGDFLFLDNHKVVHGREPFQARFDGTDRWLKRVNATRDLRKSRAHHSSGSLRVIG